MSFLAGFATTKFPNISFLASTFSTSASKNVFDSYQKLFYLLTSKCCRFCACLRVSPCKLGYGRNFQTKITKLQILMLGKQCWPVSPGLKSFLPRSYNLLVYFIFLPTYAFPNLLSFFWSPIRNIFSIKISFKL